ncbi:MAG TPA: plastocyanin/azurin family copper-binding protein [Solirubrobacterales bacterium]|jgi:plastocyanin
MDNETLFYVAGIALAVSAVLFTVAALRFEKFPGRAAPFVALWFVVLVGCATTFAVLHAQDEKEHEEATLSEASHEAEAEEAEVVDEGASAEGGNAEEPAKTESESTAETLELAADPAAIAFDTTSLESKPGKVTIDFSNPSSLEHDVAIEQGGEEIAVSETITQGETSVSAELAPGTYTFLCTVPGHAEAGMEGTLTVR